MWVMNYRNAAANVWLLCAQWVADVMNHTAEKSIGWKPPLQVLTGQTLDISIVCVFMFWDIVYVPRYKSAKTNDNPGYNAQIGTALSSEV